MNRSKAQIAQRDTSTRDRRLLIGLWVLIGMFVQAMLTPVHATAPLVHETRMAADPAYAVFYSLCDQSEKNELDGSNANQAAASCMGCCPGSTQSLGCCVSGQTVSLLSWHLPKQVPLQSIGLANARPERQNDSRGPPARS